MDHRELLFLRALRRTNVLHALVETAGTADSVATETQLTPEAAAFALEMLTELGYLARVGDTYEPTNELLGFLTTTDVRSIGTLPADLDRVDALVQLEQTLQGIAPGEMGDRELVNALGAAATIDSGQIEAVANTIHPTPQSHREALLIAGAPGRLAVELAERGLAVTLADKALAIEQSEAILSGSDVTTIRTEEWSDVPVSSFVVVAPGLRTEPTPWRPLLSAGVEALEAGGSLVLIERLHETDGPDPLRRIQDMAQLGRTIDRSISAVRTYIESEGLTVVDTSEIADSDLVGVTAQRPRD